MAIMRDTAAFRDGQAAEPTRLLAMERDTFRDARGAQSLGTTVEFDQVIRARLEALGTRRLARRAGMEAAAAAKAFTSKDFRSALGVVRHRGHGDHHARRASTRTA